MEWKNSQNIKTLFLGVIAILLVGASAAVNTFIDSGFENYDALTGGMLLTLIAVVLIIIRGKIFPEKVLPEPIPGTDGSEGGPGA